MLGGVARSRKKIRRREHAVDTEENERLKKKRLKEPDFVMICYSMRLERH